MHFRDYSQPAIRLLNIDAKCKEIIFPTTMEVLKNVAVNIRRASIMELVSCVAGLWLGCGWTVDWTRSVANTDTAAMSQKT